MSAKKTAWHPPFTHMLEQRRPRWITVRGEVQLTTEPLRVDDLLEVWTEGTRDLTDTGGTLHAMWRHIQRVGLLEFKSPVWPFHHGDLYRLLAYGALWLARHATREALPEGGYTERLAPREVTLILAVPTINKALRDEIDALGLRLPESVGGYFVVGGALLPLLVVELRAVAEGEDDDLLRWFAGRPPQTLATARWVREHQGTGDDAMSTQATPDLFGYDEWIRQYLDALTPEQRLAGLAPEQRLAGLAPEQRLAGLTESEQVLALPDHLLRMLPEAYIATLPEDVRATVWARRRA